MTRDLSWADVAARLAPARSYWLASVTTTGAPHSAPVWGVVVEEALFVYSERSTVKARNLAADPRVVVHLESAEDVVIVHGRVRDLGVPQDRPDVVAALAAKYADPRDATYLPSADPDFDVLYRVEPRRSLAWRLDDYDASQGRWSAPPDEGPGLAPA